MKTKNGALFYAVLTVLLASVLLFAGCTANEASTGNDPLTNNNENGQGENEGGGKKPPEEEPPVEEPPVEEPCTCLDEDKEVELDENGYPVLKPICIKLKERIEEEFYISFLQNTYKDYTYGMVHYFYGVYNRSVVYFTFSDWGAVVRYYIDGVYIVPYTGFLTLWKEGEFYTLKEAYDLGLLDKNDLETIAYYASYDRAVIYNWNRETEEYEALTWKDRQ